MSLERIRIQEDPGIYGITAIGGEPRLDYRAFVVLQDIVKALGLGVSGRFTTKHWETAHSAGQHQVEHTLAVCVLCDGHEDIGDYVYHGRCYSVCRKGR
jgi:hypothetical protein